MHWRSLGDWLWLAGWGLLSSLWCLGAAAQLGPTFDEPVYVKSGLEGWRNHNHRGLLMMGTMPLPIDVQTLPLYLWECHTGVRIDAALGLNDVLWTARAMTLVFWWLLLVYARLAGRQLAGPWGGRLAVALLACEPNLLAHAALATTDIAVTACMLALLYHFRNGREAAWGWRRGVPAVWFALAILAKASALVYGPICLVVIEVERLYRAGAFACPVGTDWRDRCKHFWRELRPARKDLQWIGWTGLALTFVYCGCDWQAEASFVAWANGLPDGLPATCMRWFSSHLCIFSNAGDGLMRQVKHNWHGHGAYLLGVANERALWYYFPVLLTIKLTLPLLLAPLAVGVTRARALANWACLAALVLLVLSFNFRVQIGIRLVLPLVALGIVGLAAACVEACHSVSRTGGRQLWLAGITAALLWNLTTAFGVWPHGLCFINELWGGPEQGYRLVTDSNYDWGQGLPELVAWRRQHGGADLEMWYFGTDPAMDTLPIRNVPLHDLAVRGAPDVLENMHSRYLAVSTTLLYGQATTLPAHEKAAAFLRSCPTAGRTTTFLIYERQELERRAATR